LRNPTDASTFEAEKDNNLKVMQYLFDDAELPFSVFDGPYRCTPIADKQDKELAVVYHLHSLVDNIRIRSKYCTVRKTRCI